MKAVAQRHYCYKGLDRCIKDSVPAYLESTVDAGPLYQRHGLKAAGNISMVLEEVAEDEQPIVYQETCYLYAPSITVGSVGP